MKPIVIAFLVSASFAVGQFANAAQRPKLYFLDPFADVRTSQPLSMAADGKTIVGIVDLADETRLFRWTDDRDMRDIGRYDGFHPRASVSRDGHTIVGRALDDAGVTFPFRWTAGGGMEALPPPTANPLDEVTVGPCSNGAWGDQVVFGTLDPHSSSDDEALIRWSDGEVEAFPIEGIEDVSACSHDGSIAYGYRFVAEWPGYSLFRWNPTGGAVDLFQVEEGVFPAAIDASCSSDGGAVTANVTLADGVQRRGVFWTAETGVQILEGPPGMREPYDTIVYDFANGAPVVVGHAAERGRPFPDGVGGPHVWFDGVPIAFEALLKDRALDVENWTFYDVTHCSADGTVFTGSGSRRDPATGEYEFGAFRANIVEPVPHLPNEPPVAKAGKNIVVRTTAAKARVRLDGSESYDPNGTYVMHAWSAKGIVFDNAKLARPRATFPVGQTTVKLMVMDTRGQRDSDTVVVTVIQTRRDAGAAEALDEGAGPTR